jgi:hypothetical protein
MSKFRQNAAVVVVALRMASRAERTADRILPQPGFRPVLFSPGSLLRHGNRSDRPVLRIDKTLRLFH